MIIGGMGIRIMFEALRYELAAFCEGIPLLYKTSLHRTFVPPSVFV